MYISYLGDLGRESGCNMEVVRRWMYVRICVTCFEKYGSEKYGSEYL